MDRHHDYELTRRLETLADEGCVYILKSELRRWYGRKIAAKTLRDLEQRWKEISDGAGPLKRISNAGGIYLLASDWIELLSDEAEAEDEE